MRAIPGLHERLNGMNALRAGLFVAVALALGACSKSKPSVDTAVMGTTEIAWRHGEVSEGLAEAAQGGKPVLLYWGAVWCPPCNQLKATVFKDPAFVAMTRDFIPIYLDGDEPGAQKWGEHFGVTGYPSLVVLRADGTEITRLMGGLDLAQYPRQLELARRQTQPVSELLKLARSAPEKLKPADWDLLAAYGWPLDEGRTVPGDQVEPLLLQLAAAAPSAALRQRFALTAWAQRLTAREQASSALRPAEKPGHLTLFESVLGDAAAVRANFALLAEFGTDMLSSVAVPATAEWKRAASLLRAALQKLQADAGLSASERLDTWSLLLKLAQLESPQAPLPATLIAQVHDAANAADASAKTPHERVVLIDAAAQLLSSVGLKKEAEVMLRKEAETSATGYYFMNDLADLARERGDTVLALDWRRRAWQAASGAATRTQWGVSYASSLIELAPQDAATIEATVAQIIREAAAAPDAYYRRTRIRFERLAGKLQAWSQAQRQAAVLQRLNLQMQALCSQLPEADAARSSCTALLKA